MNRYGEFRARRCAIRLALVCCLSAGWTSSSTVAQDLTLDDFRKLRINEILASNDSVFPQNWRCRHVDMLELYNGSDKTLELDGKLGHVRITDLSRYPGRPDGAFRYMSFRGQNVRELGPGERLVIFCDGLSDLDDRTDACRVIRKDIDFNEIHSVFRLDSDGETLRLEFVQKEADEILLLHEVTYPPLRAGVSYSRFPEEPPESDQWVFTAQPSFGECKDAVGVKSSCLGTPNGGATPIRPDVELIDYSTNNPAVDESPEFRVRVTDEKIPDSTNIVEVLIHYRVDGGPLAPVPMAIEKLVEHQEEFEPGQFRKTLRKWSLWKGSIPPQAAGSIVEFYFAVADADGAQDSTPSSPICDPGIGPCNADDLAGELGPGCSLMDDCRLPFRYRVASDYDGPLVLNEVIPNNQTIIEDPTEERLRCPFTNPFCRFDDVLEIHNGGAQAVDLAGMVLSKSPFRPHKGWTFRPGSEIAPGDYLLVWTDGDDEDPNPLKLIGQDNPENPNDPEAGEHHTDFQLNASRDEIFLFDTSEHGFQVINGIRWGVSGRYFDRDFLDPEGDPVRDPVLPPLERPADRGTLERLGIDQSLARQPDGDRSSPLKILDKDEVTMPGPNRPGGDPVFRRGDANGDGAVDTSDAVANLAYQFLPDQEAPTCLDAFDVDDSGNVDVSDPIFLLARLFLGGKEIPAPGMDNCGPDGTADDPHVECVYGADCE